MARWILAVGTVGHFDRAQRRGYACEECPESQRSGDVGRSRYPLRRDPVLKPIRRLCRELVSIRRATGAVCASEYFGRIVTNLPAVIRSGNLSWADAGMAARRRRFQVDGRSVSLDGSYFGAAREIYARGVYFRRPGFQLTSTDVVVDLGAHAGLFTVLAATLAERVIAVEAQSGLLDVISRNLEENDCTGAAVVEFGLVGGRTGVFSDASRLGILIALRRYAPRALLAATGRIAPSRSNQLL